MSISLIWTSAIAKPFFIARSASQRAKERLARTVFAANRFEHRSAAGDHVEFGVEFGFEAAEADGELVESVGRDRAAPQGVEDLAAASRRYGRCHSVTPNCSLSAATSSRTTPPPTRSTS